MSLSLFNEEKQLVSTDVAFIWARKKRACLRSALPVHLLIHQLLSLERASWGLGSLRVYLKEKASVSDAMSLTEGFPACQRRGSLTVSVLNGHFGILIFGL